ncbi:unnamed protein product [Paramecium sonneborni]|uniref:PSI domain-containing protein n=1 Tax=Paramecium sonneborni TaxID=65129 RepID=A0A8S1K1L7_9CILI|nr:unnamed protein product [Paramecium sonneborni]
MQIKEALLFLLILQSLQQGQNICVCGHLGNQEKCAQSIICKWDGLQCSLKEATEYITKITQLDPSNCKIYPQEKCNTLENCGFHLNQCTEFQDCSIFQKDQCSDSSYRCVSDGEKCIEVKECEDYMTNTACQNKNKDGKYCGWDISNIPNCKKITDCSLLPEYFKSDQECRQAISYCTVSKKSYGCQESGESCNDQQNENQCITNRDQQIKCYWNPYQKSCKDLKCENLIGQTDEACKKILSKCTTNGVTCTDRKRCQDAQNIEACITDENNNKCAYNKKQCTIKNCSTASQEYSNYYLCQGYDQKLDCVSVKGGGCKNRPSTCIGFEQELDCDLQQQLGCMWYDDKCFVKQCSYAPQSYGQSECKKFGICIGKYGGGCQDYPETCDLIQHQEFCEFDKAGNWCKWSQNKCVQLICTNFIYPAYDTHEKCQAVSKKCTYSSQLGNCVDYLCEAIPDQVPCLQDYNGNKCMRRFGCIDKQCSKAPIEYNTNSKCEEWISNCTVNVLVFGSNKLLKGCTMKKSICEEYYEQQCYTTKSGQKCKWSINQCIAKQCSDAELTYVTNEDCLQYKLKLITPPCILKVSGNGCQDWPTQCTYLGNQRQCNYGLYDGTQCYWDGSSCKSKICSNAATTLNSNILCNEFNPSCILDSDSMGCRDRPADLLCSDASDSPLFDSHQKCYAWNNKCTVKPIVGCVEKSNLCSDYLFNQCSYTISGQKCTWNNTLKVCTDIDCESLQFSYSINNQNCENYDINCTVSRPTCIEIKLNCNQYTDQQSCVINQKFENCLWNGSTNICSEVQCETNTWAQNESQCFGWKQGFKCQFKLNSNGTYGPGCETRKTDCSYLSELACNKTVLQNGSRCLYTGICTTIGSEDCSSISTQGIQQHHICQYHAEYCIGNLQNEYGRCQHKYYCGSYGYSLCNFMHTNYNDCVYDSDYNYCRYKPYCDSIQNYSKCSVSGVGIQCYWDDYCRIMECSMISRFSDYQCFDVSKQCRYDGVSCVDLRDCYDIQNRLPSECNVSITIYGEKCFHNGSICRYRTCNDFTSPIDNYQCYRWVRYCIKDASSSYCISPSCTGFTDIYQCLRNGCKWQYGYGCIQNIRCSYNTTATLNYDCELLSPICKLNYRHGQGCEFRSCADITNSDVCNISRNYHWVYCIYSSQIGQCIHLKCISILSQSTCQNAYGYYDNDQTFVSKCYWCNNTCSHTNSCSSTIKNPPLSHNDCFFQNPNQTITYEVSTCTYKQLQCTDYIYYKECVSTITGQKCQWDTNQNPSCIDYCLTKSQAGLTHTLCQAYHKQCVANSTSSQCIFLDCNNYTTESICNSITNFCMWEPIDSKCVKFETYLYCHRFNLEADCNTGYNSDNNGCLWNSIDSRCENRTCDNYVGVPPTSLQDCKTWLKHCEFDQTNNVCIQDCTGAPKSQNYDTISECENYYLDKSCTIVPGLRQCQDLFIECSLYLIDQMCNYDSSYNVCYWSIEKNKCFTLDCSILDSINNSHLKCNQMSKKCTVNSGLSGCIELDDCINYTIQQQCIIDKNGIDCEWQNNSCLIKTCQTATLGLYTPTACQTYFSMSICTSNNNSDGCFEGLDACKKYNKEACSLTGQVNSQGIPCFWDKEQGRCREKTCSNAPSNLKSNEECEGFLEYKLCQLIGCKQMQCNDYAYRNDETCKYAMENFKCTTNGYECVERASCDYALLEDACTFDSQMNECQWFDHPQYLCVLKSCDTASIQFNTHIECENYLKGCTNKNEGGCTILKTCTEIKTQDGCKKDINNEECIWDTFYQKCFKNECEGFCGDGMIQIPNEECDDGNYLPYDGCYDCKIQCPLGCNSCNGFICEKCNAIKGYYYNQKSEECETKCGDKIVNGQEYCDDGNDIEYDGCYKCEYSCDIYCLNCFQGQCIECLEGFYENGPYCKSKCGDGILNPYFEECDDGNIKIEDGCNQYCIIETNWRCKVIQSLSECYYLVYPKITLTLLTKQTEQTQDVMLTFSEKVKLNSPQVTSEDFLNQIQVFITNKQSVDFSFSVVPINQISYELNEVSYRITLTIKEQIIKPNLKVQIKSIYLVNEYDNKLLIDSQDLILNDSYVVSDSSKSVAASAAFLSQLIIYSVLSLAVVSFLSGNLEILFNLIDVLQQLSYIRYININFPYHLDLYFDVFSFVTIQPLLDSVKINTFFEDYFNIETPEIFAFGKFNMFGINAYFGLNFQSFLVCLILGFGNYLIAIIITYILKKPKIGWGDTPNKIKRYFYLITMKIYSLLFSTSFSYMKYFFFSGLIRIVLSNYYDLTFSALLQVINFKTETALLKYSSLLACATLILNASIILIFYASLSKKNVFQKNLFVLVDGLNIGRNQWNKQFNTVNLFKKLCFIYSLILLQGNPFFQTLLISFISASFAIYVLLLQPFQHQFENYKIIVTEFCLSFNTLSFIIYCIPEILSNNQIFNMLGWLNIILFSVILTFCLGLDTYSQFLQLKRIYDRATRPLIKKPKLKVQTLKLFTVIGDNEISF